MSPSIPLAFSQAPVGLFDSGVGGLSIWRALRQSLPNENLLYLADSQCAPYGDRSPEWIVDRTQRMAQILVDQGCKALVIACNTATLVAASTLRARLDMPIIAIEPAIKPAAALTRSRIVALMATSRTLDSSGLRNLIDRYASDIEVVRIPCPGLADRVEALQLSGPDIEAELREKAGPRPAESGRYPRTRLHTLPIPTPRYRSHLRFASISWNPPLPSLPKCTAAWLRPTA